ncbi:hypothetical protein N0V90_010558 [Kalmusia sp. IMI 367209]|nr:hypothetical protein N0V90_010558 [Kalmusia sp. IMI 367209]
MGITALWNVIKEQDRSVPIAQLAEEHFKQHGRPLRIAVDEADWRFNNLTMQQVYMIRESSNQPAFQGIEKSMFYRICRLLALNIQLLFVFDGASRPWKRGRRGGGKNNSEERTLLKQLLTYFQVPYHEAPGEAEAECARLQQLGVVDAVFSQDSDTLMFGTGVLIRDDRVAKEKGNNDRSKENTKKSGTTVRVVYGQEIKDKHNMDREGLVLFAMLCGGDYDVKGLPGCGPAMATRVVHAGLGASLCQCKTKIDCAKWRERLVACIQSQKGSRIVIPHDFPDIETLDKYNRPKISSDEKLRNLCGLRNGWDARIDELELLEATSSRFSIWGRLYMNWVGPVLLTKYLVARNPSLPKEDVHQIKLTKKRHKDTDQSASLPLLKQLTFCPFDLTTLQRKDFEGDRAHYWTNVVEDNFDPEHRVKAEIPTYLLQRALPSDVLDPPPTQKKTPLRRKRQAEDNDVGSSAMSSGGSKRRQPRSNASLLDATFSEDDYYRGSAPASIQCSHSIRPKPSKAEYISLLSDSDEHNSPSSRFSTVKDLGGTPSDSKDSADELNRAIQLSLQELEVARRSDGTSNGSASRGFEIERDSMAFTRSLHQAEAAPDSSSTAETCAARLRFFGSQHREEATAPTQTLVSMQGFSTSHRSGTNTDTRPPAEEIETIDLT